MSRIALALVASFGLATCKFDSGDLGDRACNVDTDCRPDQTCSAQGQCAQIQCTAPEDCGPGFQYDCQAGLCVGVQCTGVEGECAIGYQCTNGFCAMDCAGLDTDLDGICDTVDNCVLIANRNQVDADGDERGDACDTCPNDPDNDVDGDSVCGDVDNCSNLANTDQLNRDGDAEGDACDTDDDNDGLADTSDPSSVDPKICGDSDSDGCDDCAVGVDGFGSMSDINPGNDGPDHDGDAQCDAGDADDDNDGVPDSGDLCPRGDTGWISNASTDVDSDGCQDAAEDTDDDNDGVADAQDIAPTNNRICGDSDADTCDDCANGIDGFGPLPDKQPGNDGLDSDADGSCNAGDTDDDDDTILDAADTDPLDRFKCRDLDGDSCDDCAVTGGPPSVSNDGLDTDIDGQCNASDADDDNDGVIDTQDVSPLDRFACRDADGDTCDDCSVTGGPPAITNDGLDTDGDNQCDQGDTDDDNDGVGDGVDIDAKDPKRCRDTDSDTCDDCSVGSDGLGPSVDFNPANDGADSDADGLCNAGDVDDDNDTVPDSVDADPLNKNICRDTDNDGCDDCAVTGGPPSVGNDGLDTDGDGTCNTGDTDDDNDSIADGADTNPLDRFKCRDLDNDTCDDCAVTGGPPDPANDGIDTDTDGTCNAGDADDDNDTILDTVDANPIDKFACRDADNDACDDCSITGGPPSDANDGLDTDTDGLCNTGDPDDDNDGVADAQDVNPLNRFACRDNDNDTCDDCSVTGGPPNIANDGLDSDGDGLCNGGDTDDDNDTVADASDISPLDRFRCRDVDVDSCDDCSVTGGPPNPLNDGPDADANGICDVGDPDADGDTVPNSQDVAPTDNTRCQDLDSDGCDDCTGGRSAANPPGTSNDGLDTDGDGKCNTGDPDDDNDGVLDGTDGFPTDNKRCGDTDGDTCDDCAVGVDGFGPAPDSTPNNDGLDTDADGSCNAGDTDDDNDGVLDGADIDPVNRFRCRDVDTDSCDDCAVTGGPPSTSNDGTDTDADGSCNTGDFDDDNDGVADVVDTNSLDPKICSDTDGDTCDDCAIGVDGLGPLADNKPGNDGLDTDADGQCNAGDTDDDNDTVLDTFDVNPLDKFRCRDVDSDTCDDCAVTGGPPATANDGLDTDADGACNAGDPDDDNDAVNDGQDTNPTNKFVCRDLDTDSCDDCAVTGGPPSTTNDGLDTDVDGLCNAGDADDDNDGVTDGFDSSALNPDICRDLDTDTCDDCAVGTDNFGPLADFNTTNDGLDTDADGICNAGDPDDDNDGVPDTTDTDPVNRFVCADTDIDTCDDCSVTGGPANPANDGPDANSNGVCDAGEQCNAEIAFVAAGALVAASADGSSLTPVIPAGAVSGDFAIVIVAGHPEDDSTDPSTPSGWTKRTGSFLQLTSADDLKVITYFKFLVASEPNPTFALPVTWTSSNGNTAGASAQIAVYRNVDIRSPFDVTDAVGSSAANTTFVPPSVSTITNNSWVATAVATADDNNLSLSSANEFVPRMSGTSYHTTVGADHAMGLADSPKQVIAGSPTMPTWSQGATAPDAWVSITFALRPVNGKVCTGVIEIAGGGDHTCAIVDAPGLRCWGEAALGQLGYGNTSDLGDQANELPTPNVNLGVSVTPVHVATGLEHTCAIVSTGKVKCWGNGANGRLGYGATTTLGDNGNEMPTADVNLGSGGNNNAVQIVAGDLHTCALTSGGAVKCWGAGANGRLGNGAIADIGDQNGEVPVTVTLAANNESVVQIAAGAEHTCALINPGGKVRCWGKGADGRLGYGNTNDVGGTAAPTSPQAAGDVNLGGAAAQLAAGGKHTCAQMTTGAVKCWGKSDFGQLGYGNKDSIGDAAGEMPPVDVDFGGSATQVIAGSEHTCVRLTSTQDGGAVRCWGHAVSGQLGYGNKTDIGDTEAPSAAGDVPLGRAVVKLFAGRNHNCALLDVGDVRCWGLSVSGALGYGNKTTIGDDELPSSVGFVPIE